MPPRRSSEPDETTCRRCGKRLVRLVLWVDPTTYFRPSHLLSSLDAVQAQQVCLHEPAEVESGQGIPPECEVRP